MGNTHSGRPLGQVRDWLRGGEPERAAAACKAVLEDDPRDLNALLLYSRALEQLAELEGMLNVARQAAELKPRNTDANLRLAHALLLCGDVTAAMGRLRLMEQSGGNRHRLLLRVGDLHAEFGWTRHAHRCHLRAMELESDNPAGLVRTARSCLELGMSAQAETILERAIFLDPEQHAAWYLLACLRQPQGEDNQVRELSYMIDRLDKDAPGRVSLLYALARQLDGLGRYDEAFLCLREGAELRRGRLGHDVALDAARMGALAMAAGATPPGNRTMDPQPAGPILVCGLPCSGVGRVIRIIGSHRDKERAGLAILYPFQQLQALLGLQPSARIIHVRRHPMDQCMAIYRTLFRDRHPYSYSLVDIGRYYLAYTQLMACLSDVFPGAILEVDYGQLLTTRERQLRRILDHAALDWYEDCLGAMERHDPDAGIRLRYRSQLAALQEQLAAN